jgi:hypothetical protein
MNIQTILEEFRKKYCNDHNGEVRFLRSVFYDEKDGAQEIEAFIEQALTNQKQEILDKVKEKAEGLKDNDEYCCSNAWDESLDTLIKELDNI